LLVADDGVASPVGDEFDDESGAGFGQDDRLGTGCDEDLVAAGVDVSDGEAADRGRRLLGLEVGGDERVLHDVGS
jgi:hypothetical protein